MLTLMIQISNSRVQWQMSAWPFQDYSPTISVSPVKLVPSLVLHQFMQLQAFSIKSFTKWSSAVLRAHDLPHATRTVTTQLERGVKIILYYFLLLTLSIYSYGLTGELSLACHETLRKAYTRCRYSQAPKFSIHKALPSLAKRLTPCGRRQCPRHTHRYQYFL